MAKPTLFLTTEDPYAIYGPSEKIRGTANLDIVNPSPNVKYIIVSLLAGSSVAGPGATKSIKQNFFHKQFNIVFHCKREDTTRGLLAGQHKWDFNFTLPSANDLPPSFWYRDDNGSAEITYSLVMYVYHSNSTQPTKENTTTLAIKYCPKRSPSIIIDGSLIQLCQQLLVKRYRDEVPLGRKRKRFWCLIKRVASRQKAENEHFRVTLWIPRYAAFTDHMNISLRVQTADEDPLRMVEVRLTKVEYRLIAFTRVAHDQASRISRHSIQSSVCVCNSLLEINSHGISLRRHAPFRVQPKTHGIPLDKTTFSTLGPSFATNNIIREYSLDIDLFFHIYGKTHRVRFDNNELILLPHEMYLVGG